MIIRAMPSLFASDALLPSGWARDVLIDWDDGGLVTRVQPGAAPANSPRAAGPVLPGMANVHSHAFQRAMAGLAEHRGHPTDDFWTWREAMYDLVRRVEPQDVEAIAAHLYIELLKHGYTSVGEFHYLHRDRDGNPYADIAELAERIVAAARASGIALTLLPVMYSFGGFGGRALDAAQRRFASDPEGIAALLETLRQRHGSGLRLGVAPHSVRAVDAGGLSEILAAADRFEPSMPVHMHLSEQTREVRECLETHAATPFDWLSSVAKIDARWCFIHATHVTPTEASRIAAGGASVGLCPTTEANLGDGIFDFAAWLDAAGRWGIGGDSHVSISPFDELRALEYSQRLKARARNIAASEARPEVATNLWQAAALGGATALAQPAGALLPGRRADLVVLDGADADFEGLSAATALAVAMFSGSASRVRDVFVAGRRVVREGRHDREDPASNAFRGALRRLRARGS
jgi:formimidoylglutamate deiminase